MDSLINFVIVCYVGISVSKRQVVKRKNLTARHANTLSSLVLLYSTVISVAFKNNSVIFSVLTLCEDIFSCNVTILDSWICAGISTDSELIATNILVSAIVKAIVDGSKSE